MSRQVEQLTGKSAEFSSTNARNMLGIDAEQERSPKLWFGDIDRAKAVAILLVVIGHIPDGNSPEWARLLRFYIYNFHMPLFMYLSGYLYYSSINNKNNISLKSYFINRADRLLVAFAIFGFMVVNLKYFGKSVASLNRSDFSYIEGFKFLFVSTSQSPALDLWYLFVLFEFSIFSFILLRQLKLKLIFINIFSACLYAIFAYHEPRGGMIDELYADRICWFYLFFTIGMTACRYRNYLDNYLQFWYLAAALLFVCAEYISSRPEFLFLSGWRFLYVSIPAIAFIHGICMRNFAWGTVNAKFLSKNTLIIFLTNTMIIAACQQAFYRFHVATDVPYGVQLIVLIVVGTLTPIAIRNFVISKEYLRPVGKYIT